MYVLACHQKFSLAATGTSSETHLVTDFALGIVCGEERNGVEPRIQFPRHEVFDEFVEELKADVKARVLYKDIGEFEC